MFDSVRSRLTIWYIAVLALVIISFAVLSYSLTARLLNRATDENLAEMARNFKTSLDSEQTDETEQISIEKDIIEAVGESNFHDYIFTVTDGNTRQIASTADANKISAQNFDDFRENFQTIKGGGESYRVYYLPLDFGTQKYNLFVARSLEDQTEFLTRLRSIFFVSVPLTVFWAALGGYFLAKKSLAPIALMSRRAAEIGAANLHERLPVNNEKDELGDLAQVFNRLLERLENSFEQQRQFMADASHELRTPLAIVRGESEIAISKPRSTADYRESLHVVHDESKRLTRIVEDLFTLARADAGQTKPDQSDVYLDELIAESIRAVHVLAQQKNVRFEFAAAREMPVRGDEQLLRRLFVNLFDNAIKYNRTDGKVSVTAETGAHEYRILIGDTGAGIDEDDRTKIFQRFYRADRARSRSAETLTSGAGLGLSIALWIAELHHGTIEIVSTDDAGSVFAVILPIRNEERERSVLS